MHSIIVHEIQGKLGRLRVRFQNCLSKTITKKISEKLENIKGLKDVCINPRTGSVLFCYEHQEARLAALECLGVEDTNSPPSLKPQTLAIVEKLLFIPKKILHFPLLGQFARYFILRPLLPPWVRLGLGVFAALPHIFKGLQALFNGKINVDLLDATAIIVSYLQRDFQTASLLVFLLNVGEALEEWTRKASRDSLAQSLALDIDNVWVRIDGTEVRKPFSELSLDDEVIIRTGTIIMVDGVVVDGEAIVNQSSMTGEPQGVVRTAGNSVFAGTVVEEGLLVVRPTKLGSETRLQKIIEFIEDSQKLKAGIEGRAMRMADAAVPFTFLLADLVYLITRDPIRASSVLLVDYSCALRLATPLAILSTMREGASRGVLIKGGVFLENLAEADTVVFDKTGTLTEAKPEVAEVVACKGHDPKEVLRLAACMEEHFPHPVARAVVRQAEIQNLMHQEEHGEVEYIVAHGIASKLFGDRVLLGSRHYVCDDENIDVSELDNDVNRLIELGYSLLYIAKGGKAIGVVAIRDTVRAEAAQVITELKESGIKRVIMLTGDDERAAKNMANRLGITEFHAGILPVDKARIVQELQEEGAKVIMVGDGINDAPALSMANVGVSMRDATDLAQEVADVVLLESHLHSLVIARKLAKSTLSRINGNFIINMSLNSVFLGLGLFNAITPTLSAVMHNVTTVGITLNAMRPHLPITYNNENPNEAVVNNLN